MRGVKFRLLLSISFVLFIAMFLCGDDLIHWMSLTPGPNCSFWMKLAGINFLFKCSTIIVAKEIYIHFWNWMNLWTTWMVFEWKKTVFKLDWHFDWETFEVIFHLNCICWVFKAWNLYAFRQLCVTSTVSNISSHVVLSYSRVILHISSIMLVMFNVF